MRDGNRRKEGNILSRNRSGKEPAGARTRWVAGTLVATSLLVAACTSVSQMQQRYQAGDESQFGKLLAVAGRRDYPYATRKAAVKVLGEIRDGRAVPTLTAILGEFDQRTTLKGEALVALGLIGDPTAVTAIGRLLDRSLNQTSDEVRLAAIPVLGVLGGQEAAGILVNALSYYDLVMLRDERAVQRGVFTGDEQSIRALQDSLRAAGRPPAGGRGALGGQQFTTSGMFGPDPGFTSQPVEDTTPKERALAHESLVRVGEVAVPVIQEFMTRRESTVSLRNELAEILTEILGAGEAAADSG